MLEKKGRSAGGRDQAKWGTATKPSKKIGCPVRLVIKVLVRRPQVAIIELEGVHNHGIGSEADATDLRCRRVDKRLVKYVQ